MKKIAILSMAALAVVSVKAAQVEWTSGDLSAIATSEIESVTAYYYVLSDSDYATQASMTSEALVNQYLNTSKGSLNATYTPDATVQADVFGNADWTQDDKNGDPTVTDPAYVAVVYKFTTFSGGAYAIATTASYEVGDGIFNDPELDLSGNLGAVAFSNANGNWTPVPEPTTVALLALGLAAVGLKRKVA